MCTQQLIWCNCGHGEFLPIEKCTRATTTGYCWTIVWGDHSIIVPGSCSYCKQGLNKERPLGSALPREQQGAVDVDQRKTTEESVVDGFLGGTGLLTPPLELDDVINTDFTSDFDLSRDFWQYA